jgi:hypothetical protein
MSKIACVEDSGISFPVEGEHTLTKSRNLDG